MRVVSRPALVSTGQRVTIRVRRCKSFVVLVHGVQSGEEQYVACLEWVNRRFAHLLPIPFSYGPIPVLDAAGVVGTRQGATHPLPVTSPPAAHQALAALETTHALKGLLTGLTALSRSSWRGVDRLKVVVSRLRELGKADTTITVLSHSNGTVVTLAALQEDMQIDNWILMGSCLNREAVRSGAKNTRLAAAAGRVKGWIVNCCSTDDQTAPLKGGITAPLTGGIGGDLGLPNKIDDELVLGQGLVPVYVELARDGRTLMSVTRERDASAPFDVGDQSPANLMQVWIPKTSHFALPGVPFQYPNWWGMEWVDAEDRWLLAPLGCPRDPLEVLRGHGELFVPDQKRLHEILTLARRDGL